jgi:hypothetical protein
MKHSTLNYIVGFLLIASGCSSQSFNGSSKKAAEKKPQEGQATPAAPEQPAAGPEITTQPQPEPSEQLGNPDTIPGTPTQRVGIHFEDGSDNDFNDVAICFDAPFKASSNSYIMAQPEGQRVTVSITRTTGREPNITIKVFGADGTEVGQPVFVNGLVFGVTKTVDVFFPFGSKLYAKYEWYGSKAGAADTQTLGKHIKIQENVCNNTGR